jgi:hypothetical protein
MGMTDREYYIEARYKGYKGCSTQESQNHCLFTIKTSNDGELLAVYNFPIQNQEECLKYLIKGLEFLNLSEVEDGNDK